MILLINIKSTIRRMFAIKEPKSQIHCNGLFLCARFLSIGFLFVILSFGGCSTPNTGEISPIRKEIESSVSQMLDSTHFLRNEGFIVVNILDYDTEQFSFVMSYFYHRSDVIDDIQLYLMHRNQKILVKFGKCFDKGNRGVVRRELGSVLEFKSEDREDIDEFYRIRDTCIFTYTQPYFLVEYQNGEKSCTVTHGYTIPRASMND